MENKTLITGFPRIGEHRELKKALEARWSGALSADELQKTASSIREKHWLLQKEKGIDLISCNDFSLYDNMLDTIVMLNALPERFRGIEDPMERYFAMARGADGIPAMEMTKWFNTNYHYIVPELDDQTEFSLDSSKIFGEYIQALKTGIPARSILSVP
jgi:5-methyltetrahydropteroyltriglutamate--homocysteine methyltransferase